MNELFRESLLSIAGIPLIPKVQAFRKKKKKSQESRNNLERSRISDFTSFSWLKVFLIHDLIHQTPLPLRSIHVGYITLISGARGNTHHVLCDGFPLRP
ncbi:hypothetical protein Y032_0410g942 [Ancylostoma ceylanicum]|uniref:Uncharacterized protein n=1 Tax=Ancylostoma ceylanicum TaxID=53326 RepID=A0A016X4A2_9BILA|nr:hypothetical protein Y032_0410g942 [Ancylostoma ceylanicum]